MIRCDYEKEVYNDVTERLFNNLEYYLERSESIEDLEEILSDDCFISDDVTGNASGSYTFNAHKAEENLAGNWELLADVLEEFGYDNSVDVLRKGAEWCDVTIRCYFVGSAVHAVVADNLEMIEKAFEDFYNRGE